MAGTAGMALANGDWLRIPHGAHVPDVAAVLPKARITDFQRRYKDNPQTVDLLATEYNQELYVIRAWAMQLGLVKQSPAPGKPEPVKVCKICGDPKPLSAYSKMWHSRDGLNHKCNSCLRGKRQHAAKERAMKQQAVAAVAAAAEIQEGVAALGAQTAPDSHPFALLRAFFDMLPATPEAVRQWTERDMTLWVEAVAATAHMLYARAGGAGMVTDGEAITTGR